MQATVQPVGKPKPPSSIEQAALILRERALATEPGQLIGSEDEVVASLGVARVTARQAARLVERDGLLRVRRGKKGGYFSARPSVEMVEAVVCAYLDTLGIEAMHTGGVATALWVEAVRQAAMCEDSKRRDCARRLTAIAAKLDDDAPMRAVSEAEHAYRSAVFDLIGGDYLRTIFQINAAFSRSRLPAISGEIDAAHHREFIRKWRSAKLLAAEAIADGDILQAVLSALADRNAWTARGGSAWRDGTAAPGR